MINVKSDIKRVRASVKKWHKEAVPVAAYRAMNRAVAKSKTATSRQLSKETGFKVGVVKRFVHVFKASRKRLVATLKVRGRRIGVFSLRNPRVKQQKKGITYKIGRAKKYVDGGFIATMPGGHKGIFSRKGRSRLPIEEEKLMSNPEIFIDSIKKEQEKQVLTTFNEVFGKQLDHEMNKVDRKRGRT